MKIIVAFCAGLLVMAYLRRPREIPWRYIESEDGISPRDPYLDSLVKVSPQLRELYRAWGPGL